MTEAWGSAPVVFAGQGKRDHLRVAIQMLSGAVPRHTVYGHLGWRKISDEWAFLHNDGAIGSDGCRNDVEIENAQGPMAWPTEATMWPTRSCSSCCGAGPCWWM